SIEKLPSRAGSAPNNNPEPSAPRRERLALRRLRQVPRRWLRHLLTHVPQRRRDRAVVAPVRPQRAEVDAPRPRVDAPQVDARLEIYLRRHPRVVRAADDLQTVDVVVEARAGRPDDRRLPRRQENIAGVLEAAGDGHVAARLVEVLQLLEELRAGPAGRSARAGRFDARAGGNARRGPRALKFRGTTTTSPMLDKRGARRGRRRRAARFK
ncbi:unnamed protein product, partial [Pelagomonas calceolata]